MVNALSGNGLLRWLAGLVIAALISYFTAKGSIEVRVAVVEERENAHFSEVQRSLGRIEAVVTGLQNRQPAASLLLPQRSDPGPPLPGFETAKSVH